MVKQKQRTKNSSSGKPEHQTLDYRGLPTYRFPSYVDPVSLVPETTELKLVDDLGPRYAEGVPGYFISGSLENAKESLWSEPPHLAFANLRAEDPKAAEAFTKRYGVLARDCFDRDDPHGMKFTIDSATLLHWQENLRQAWSGDTVSVVDIEGEVEEGFASDVVVSGRFVLLRPEDVWRAICFLFLMDAQADKLGLCQNPDCPAPFFRKKRRTQKYCEQGPCVQYAQRQYSLDWWNRVGKKKREKKAKAARGGRP